MSRPRIVGGSAKGRTLQTPASGTRPSPVRLREALFDIVAFEPRGRFLDLFAGSGAVGLEAASRGFAAVCVELAKQAAAVIAANAKALDLDVEVVRGDAIAFARSHPGRFGIVFAAPPYPLDLHKLFASVIESGAAEPSGLYVLQHPSDFKLEVPDTGPLAAATREARVKRYGSNSLTLVRVPGIVKNG
ncbi:MAG TPA: RsmD family RNA methyltransferase [Trueperaceae bacterium]|nr:RsmD family RNA methyltransferase [Trueperaceae bacterium]